MSKKLMSVFTIGIWLFSAAICLAEEDMLAKAKTEGEVTYYGAAPRYVMGPVLEAFQEKYGIKVMYVRKGTGRTIQQIEAERQAGIKKVDVFDIPALSTFARWKEQGFISAYRPHGHERFIEDFLQEDWFEIPVLPLFVLPVYNTRLLKPEEAPKSWKAMLDPKWKGKLVHADPNYSGNVSGMVNVLINLHGWEYYENLAKNEPKLVQSITAVPRIVLSGEAWVGVGSVDGDARGHILKGEPIQIIYPEDGSVFQVDYLGVTKEAPHPNAARLLIDFMVSKEGQQVIVKTGYSPVRDDVEPPKGAPTLKGAKLLKPDFKWLKKHKKEQNEKFLKIMGM